MQLVVLVLIFLLLRTIIRTSTPITTSTPINTSTTITIRTTTRNWYTFVGNLLIWVDGGSSLS